VVRTVLYCHGRAGVGTPDRSRHYGFRHRFEQRGLRKGFFHGRERDDWRKHLRRSWTDWDWWGGPSEFGPPRSDVFVLQIERCVIRRFGVSIPMLMLGLCVCGAQVCLRESRWREPRLSRGRTLIEISMDPPSRRRTFLADGSRHPKLLHGCMRSSRLLRVLMRLVFPTLRTSRQRLESTSRLREDEPCLMSKDITENLSESSSLPSLILPLILYMVSPFRSAFWLPPFSFKRFILLIPFALPPSCLRLSRPRISFFISCCNRCILSTYIGPSPQ